MVKEIHVLERKEIFEKLKYFNGWRFKNNKIYKEFKFDDFFHVVKFINKLTGFFDRNDHHPDIHIFYNRVLFELQRFDVGGFVTDMDFVTAGEIERVYQILNPELFNMSVTYCPINYQTVEV